MEVNSGLWEERYTGRPNCSQSFEMPSCRAERSASDTPDTCALRPSCEPWLLAPHPVLPSGSSMSTRAFGMMVATLLVRNTARRSPTVDNLASRLPVASASSLAQLGIWVVGDAEPADLGVQPTSRTASVN